MDRGRNGEERGLVNLHYAHWLIVVHTTDDGEGYLSKDNSTNTLTAVPLALVPTQPPTDLQNQPITVLTRAEHFTSVDRKGESEESGDEETKRKSLNGEVDPQQSPSAGKEEVPVDMDTITLDPEEEVNGGVVGVDVDLVHCRIGKIEGLEVLQKAKTLSLRQNLIKKMENLDSLTSLRELDLYDNQIRRLENLQNLTELE
ncbi:hypothetical protein JZ751_013803 [Albula glossodonta]|uniref:Protein phosphatase 1 regulatory subunit 7 n=1 Tax=Albula glossodonta TaxID=121402 RepID=A0A8T2NRT2_9TELE|nr:hypothetical protein JZ751_013803 [Albula glossodonta]